jgi:hypothetical protein
MVTEVAVLEVNSVGATAKYASAIIAAKESFTSTEELSIALVEELTSSLATVRIQTKSCPQQRHYPFPYL